jgi:hypothetical protein
MREPAMMSDSQGRKMEVMEEHSVLYVSFSSGLVLVSFYMKSAVLDWTYHFSLLLVRHRNISVVMY